MASGPKNPDASSAPEEGPAPPTPEAEAPARNSNGQKGGLSSGDARELLGVLQDVRRGDFTARMPASEGQTAQVAQALNDIVEQNERLVNELRRTRSAVGEKGELGERVALPGLAGGWVEAVDAVNELVIDLSGPIQEMRRLIDAVERGDLSQRMELESSGGQPLRGAFRRTAKTINAMVEQLDTFSSEVTRVAREVGTEGKLGGRAEIEGVSGTWKDLTDNVNSMADNLTGQVRGIAEVTTAVADGDLSKKVTVSAKGEIADLASTINAMVDTLDTFSNQVTTVAREVGVEGQLGGQAHVPGASGTWRDLTDNVNSMADNLTTQVREMIEVAESVADGDFSKEITVGAAGEVAALRDSVNEMIRTLKATTQENRNQDWLKSNLTRVTRALQSEEELRPLASMVLSELAPLTGARHGAFYLAEYAGEEPVAEDPREDPEALRLISTYAHNRRKRLANRFTPGEGLVGQCALEKEPILLSGAPSDYVQIGSGLGEAEATQVVVVPVMFESKVRAVLELASFETFDDIQLTFLNQLADSIGIVVNTIQTSKRTEALLEQSQQLTSRLQAQQEELTETNDELEAQAEQLERQQEEVSEKEREIELARDAIEEKAEQLELTSKYRSEFLANMSHELRTPLNSMLILARMFSENKQGNLTEEQVEYAETMHASGADLLSLINEILDLSKIESGSMTVEAERVATRDVAENMERLFREVAAQGGLDFSVTVDDGVPETITTDEKRLQQVLKNLLSNALKFTDEGEVNLRIARGSRAEHFESGALKQAGEIVAFAVSDTGVGIGEEQQDLIFEAFQQAEGGDARAHGGTGLGLSISREIADLLGGELRLESVPGEGSTFTFFLPAVYDEAAAAERAERRQETQRQEAQRQETQREHQEQQRRSDLEERAQRPQEAGRGPRRSVEAADGKDGGGAGGGGAGGGGDHEKSDAPQREDARHRENAPQRVRKSDGRSPESSSPESSSVDDAAEAGGDGAAEAERVAAGAPGEERVEDDRDTLTEEDRVLLIVEDEARPARVLLDAARERGFKGVVARRGAEVLELARRYAPGAITLDMQLPDEHGVEVLRRLKATPETRAIPVVILSVEGALPHEERRGAVAQITKPITPESVAESLAGALEGLDEREEVRTLLIVEDDASQRTSIAALVRTGDVQVTSVGTGSEALQALKAAAFDCAIIDLGLPDMDGFALVEKVRRDLGQEDLPIIVHTAQDLVPDEADRLREMTEAIILKDVSSFDQLLEKTALFLRRTGSSGTDSDSGTDAPAEDAPAEDEPAERDTAERDTAEAASAKKMAEEAKASEETATPEETASPEAAEGRGSGLLESVVGGDGAATGGEVSPGEQAARERERVAAQKPKRQGPRQPEHPADDLSGKSVFIVDDDVQNIFALTSLLEGHDLEVDYAESGQDGIERLEQLSAEGDAVDAVLMDIMMPGMDGYETMRRMRERETFAELPIIAVTAKALKGDREKCIAAGASDYITKPVDAEQLLSLLRAWIPA